jgi:pyrimidine-nucleoside phosphorylase
MTDRETSDLTLAMAYSGEVLDLSPVAPLVVDKHSTGGVGDKVSLVVAPLVSACGLPVGKMSGRGLGFTGGTLDKLESIPGYRSNLSPDEFLAQLSSIGIVLTGQSANLAPADGILYALRDVTGTVPSTPLIAASVMSKKIAGGAHAFVLDVKTGWGAFMEKLDDARNLAELMVRIGEMVGRKVVAVISDMNQPLGQAVGNALELKEAIAILNNEGPEDLREHCLVIASHMLVLGKKAHTTSEARNILEATIENGAAIEKFKQLVRAQDGDVRYVEDVGLLPRAKYIETITAPVAGIVQEINAKRIGEEAVALGAGRAKKGDPVDHAVGFEIHTQVGDQVELGDKLFTIHANDYERLQRAKRNLLDIHIIQQAPRNPYSLFYGVIE